MNLFNRIKKAWNVFANKDPTSPVFENIGVGSSNNPTNTFFIGNSHAKAASIFNRISIDVSMLSFRHAKVDDNFQYLETIDSNLNRCLSFRANLDQPSSSFLIDAVMLLLDNGSVALVPVITNYDDFYVDADSILSIRVAKITQWYPKYIEVDIYNEETGLHEQIKIPKSYAAIIENPMYHIINDTASRLSRILGKLSSLDSLDKGNLGTKLDLIVQIPYALNNSDRIKRAKNRKKEIEDQLINSSYGIAYIDSTEKIIQLNRSIENDYIQQVQYLTNDMYHQLGWSDAIFNGTASESELLNYYNRTINPICQAIVDGINIKWLDPQSLLNMERVIYYRNPFSIAQVSDIAEISDKLIRNEILTPNEMRAVIGFKPAADPRADELRNPNISSSNDQLPREVTDDDIEDVRTYE